MKLRVLSKGQGPQKKSKRCRRRKLLRHDRMLEFEMSPRDLFKAYRSINSLSSHFTLFEKTTEGCRKVKLLRYHHLN